MECSTNGGVGLARRVDAQVAPGQGLPVSREATPQREDQACDQPLQMMHHQIVRFLALIEASRNGSPFLVELQRCDLAAHREGQKDTSKFILRGRRYCTAALSTTPETSAGYCTCSGRSI